MAVAPDGGVGVRVAGCRLASGGEAQDLAAEGVEVLRELADAGLAGRRVEEPVRPERQSAAVVDRAHRDAVEDHLGGAEGVVVAELGAQDPVVGLGAGVEVEEPIGAEVGGDRHAEQPALTLRDSLIDLAGDDRVAALGVDEEHPARVPFGHHGPVVGQEGHAPRDGETRGDLGHDAWCVGLLRGARVLGARG